MANWSNIQDEVGGWGVLSWEGKEESSRSAVGMEVFRDSLRTDSNMGTHRVPRHGLPSLGPSAGLVG